MKVSKTPAVDAALRTLAEDERRTALTWFEHLKSWDDDVRVRQMAKAMIHKDMYVLNTSDDFRIFFHLNEAKQEIDILDLAKPSRFESVGMASE